MTSFFLNTEPDEEQKRVVAELNAILEPMGSQITLNSKTAYGKEMHCLKIRLDLDQVEAHRTRGAGRKRRLVFDKHGHAPTVGEVKEMLKTKTADEVAVELGISRSTLFRRLKDAYGDKDYI